MQFDEEIQHYPFVLKTQNCGGKKCDVIGWCVVGNGMQIELGNETSSLDFGEVRNMPIDFKSLNNALGFVEWKYFRFFVNDNQGRTYYSKRFSKECFSQKAKSIIL